MTILRRIGLFFIACGLSGALGFLFGVKSRKHEVRRIEPIASEIRHNDGSITLARVNEPPPAPLPMPEGVKARTRAAIVDLAPSAKPIELQIDTLQMKDGTERVTVKGPGIIGGKDFPIAPMPQGDVEKWTLQAGMGYKSYSVGILRTVGPVDIGGMIHLDRRDRPSWDAQVIASWKF